METFAKRAQRARDDKGQFESKGKVKRASKKPRKTKKDRVSKGRKQHYIKEYEQYVLSARRIISSLFKQLEEDMGIRESVNYGKGKKAVAIPPSQEKREEILSELTKLSGVLTKIMPLEKEIASAKTSKRKDANKAAKSGKVTKEDMKILERYVERYGEKKSD